MLTFTQEFLGMVQQSTLLEWLAVLCSVVQVVLAAKNKHANFYFGIAGVAIYVFLYTRSGLYADASLNLFYVCVSAYGIAVWQQQKMVASIQACDARHNIYSAAIALVSFALSYSILSRYTSSAVPLQDSAVAAFGWAGAWLLSRRKLECWLWLNVSNAIAIPLYYEKHLALTAVLTALQFIIAIFGFVQWRKLLRV